MDVLLLSSVHGLGKAGEIHKVKPGYARNFLFPRALAKIATPDAIARAKHNAKKLQEQELQGKKELNEIQKKLEALEIKLTAKGNADGTLYGSLGIAEIREAIQKQLKKQIPSSFRITPEHLKQGGEHEVSWNLDKSQGTLQVTIEVSQ